MSKYIIKNCPAYGKRFYFDNNALGTYVQCICKDNDCILKQIVDYCKSEIEFYNNKVYKKDAELGRAIAAGNVLQLLDIQDVE